MTRQVVLSRFELATALKVTPRKLGELIRSHAVKEPVRLGHRTHRFVFDRDEPLLRTPQ